MDYLEVQGWEARATGAGGEGAVVGTHLHSY